MREVLARLFELRFFYNLIQSRKIDGEIDYESICLPGSESNIDFKFATESLTWRAELTSIRQSDTLKKEACWQEDGLFGFHGSNDELGAEVKRAQSILINKLYNEMTGTHFLNKDYSSNLSTNSVSQLIQIYQQKNLLKNHHHVNLRERNLLKS